MSPETVRTSEWYSHPVQHFGDGRLRNGYTRLSEDDREIIRALRAMGIPAATLAKRFGVHRSRIYQLLPSAMRSDLVPVTHADAGFVDLIAERGDAFEDSA